MTRYILHKDGHEALTIVIEADSKEEAIGKAYLEVVPGITLPDPEPIDQLLEDDDVVKL